MSFTTDLLAAVKRVAGKRALPRECVDGIAAALLVRMNEGGEPGLEALEAVWALAGHQAIERHGLPTFQRQRALRVIAYEVLGKMRLEWDQQSIKRGA